LPGLNYAERKEVFSDFEGLQKELKEKFLNAKYILNFKDCD
jgi:hypothetical protein